jgi:hypothetical protein
MVPLIPAACQRGARLAAATPRQGCARSYRDATGRP